MDELHDGLPVKIAALAQRCDELSKELAALSVQSDEGALRAENQKLKSQNEQILKAVSGLHDKIMALTQENRRLQETVCAKDSFTGAEALQASQHRMQSALHAQAALAQQKINALEAELKERMVRLYSEWNAQTAEQDTAFAAQINALKAQADAKLSEMRRRVERETADLAAQIDRRYAEARSAPAPRAESPAPEQPFTKENRWGAHWFSWLGAVLVLLGLVVFAGYSYAAWLRPVGRCVSLFAASALFLCVGELFMRRKMQIVGKGLLALGIAGLYASTFVSYFVLSLFSMEAAAAVSAGVCAVSVLLTRLHRSRSVTLFTLVGGYLPVVVFHFAIPVSVSATAAVMAYVLLLNAAMVTSSVYKEWNPVKYVAFSFGMAVYLLTVNVWVNPAVNLAYSLLVFFMFTFIQLAFPIRQKTTRVLSGDIILLGINTLATASVCFLIFRRNAPLVPYTGLFALCYAAVFLGLGVLVHRVRRNGRSLPWLFYLASLTFFVLAVPLQFGYAWASLGWVAQGMLLLLFGVRARQKVLEYYGWCVFALSFLLSGPRALVQALSGADDPRYHLELLSFLAAFVIFLAVYFGMDVRSRCKRWEQVVLQVFKYVGLAYTLAFVLSEAHYLYSLQPHTAILTYLYAAFAALTVLLFSIVLRRIRPLQDEGMQDVCFAMKNVFVGLTLSYNAAFFIFPSSVSPALPWQLVAVLVMLAMDADAVAVFMRLLREIPTRNPRRREFISLFTGLYLIAASFLFLVRQTGWFRYSGFLLNLVWMLLAFAFIACGLRKRYVFIRRTGLVLSLLVCVKLFVVDFFFLDTFGKIISFLVIGMISLGISYLYQKLSKKMEKGASAEALPDSHKPS